MAYIAPTDLAEALPGVSTARLAEVIADAEAFALGFAPCIASAAFLADVPKMARLKAILRAAIVYDVQSASGAAQQQTAGPFSFATDTRTPRSGVMFSPSQIAELKALCSGTVRLDGVYTIGFGVPDTLPRWSA